MFPWFIPVVDLALHSLELGANRTVHWSLLECFWSMWGKKTPKQKTHSIFFHYDNFYLFLKSLILQGTWSRVSCYLQRPLIEFSGNLGSWPSAGQDPNSWKEIALHLVQPANVLVHSCTAIDLTSFWMFTGLAIIPWIFYSSTTTITVITFALLQNLLSKDFKVLYGY